MFHLPNSRTLQFPKWRNNSQGSFRSRPCHSAPCLWTPAATPGTVPTWDCYLSLGTNPFPEHQMALHPLTAPRRWGSACRRLLSLPLLVLRAAPLPAGPLLSCLLLWRLWARPLSRFLQQVPRCALSTDETLMPSLPILLRSCWSAGVLPLWPKEEKVFFLQWPRAPNTEVRSAVWIFIGCFSGNSR